jgi:tetratricopeptide (TPR) repeat protein
MMGSHQKAEEFFLKSIELDPANGHPYLQLATAYEFQKRYPEALMILEKGLAKTNTGHSQFDAKISRIKTILLIDIE